MKSMIILLAAAYDKIVFYCHLQQSIMNGTDCADCL